MHLTEQSKYLNASRNYKDNLFQNLITKTMTIIGAYCQKWKYVI